MAVALSTLVPDLRTDIPEIPSFIAQRYLLRIIRDFCEQTRAWRVSGSITTVANVATVSITGVLPNVNSELVDVISIKNSSGGEPLVPRTIVWLDENLSAWRLDSSTAANYYVRDSNINLRLVPMPASTAIYNIRIAVKPTLSATTLDDTLANKFREVFISGALSMILTIPRKPWTDLQTAGVHAGRYERGMVDAKAEATDEFQTGIIRKVKYGGL